MKALREVWRRAENSLCADCGKPGESPRVAGGQVRGRTWSLGLVLAWRRFGAACRRRSVSRGRGDAGRAFVGSCAMPCSSCGVGWSRLKRTPEM